LTQIEQKEIKLNKRQGKNGEGRQVKSGIRNGNAGKPKKYYFNMVNKTND